MKSLLIPGLEHACGCGLSPVREWPLTGMGVAYHLCGCGLSPVWVWLTACVGVAYHLYGVAYLHRQRPHHKSILY